MNIKRCPFCGWGTIIDSGGWFSHVATCNSCGARTGKYKTWEQAIEAWNKRAWNSQVSEKQNI